jgi:prophage tail gpP-like protein
VVSLRLGGDLVAIAESYEVKTSVLQQPAAFSLRLGSDATAAQILKRYPPRTPFELWIGETRVQSGYIYERGQPSAKYTQIELQGRDYLAVIFDDDFRVEQTFTDKTYFGLTRRILDIAGLKETTVNGRPRFALEGNNDNNRELLTRLPKGRSPAHTPAEPKTETGALQAIFPTRAAGQRTKVLVEETTVNFPTSAGSGAGRMVYETIKARVGISLYEFLREQYRLAGLFLWATGDGNFVLARPNANQEPAYSIRRARGNLPLPGSIIDCRFRDSTTQRHSSCIVHGRGGAGVDGRHKLTGHYVDDELTAYGFTNVRVVHDDDVRNQQQADYVARRTIAEERRAGWQLEYTVSGHRTPSPQATGGLATWTPDTVVYVDDEELDIHGNFYLEAVTYSRSPETTTKLTLMRPEDLVFAEKLFPAKRTG